MLKSLINRLYNFSKSIEELFHSNADIIPGMRRSIQFDNYSCAAHSVSVITSHFNHPESLTAILRELGTDEDGTDTPEILKYFILAGFNVSVNTNANLEDIRRAVISGHPVIITINEWEHWIVIYGISKSRIFILDSNFKRILSCLSQNKFTDLWDDNWIAVISPRID